MQETYRFTLTRGSGPLYDSAACYSANMTKASVLGAGGSCISIWLTAKPDSASKRYGTYTLSLITMV